MVYVIQREEIEHELPRPSLDDQNKGHCLDLLLAVSGEANRRRGLADRRRVDLRLYGRVGDEESDRVQWCSASA